MVLILQSWRWELLSIQPTEHNSPVLLRMDIVTAEGALAVAKWLLTACTVFHQLQLSVCYCKRWWERVNLAAMALTRSYPPLLRSSLPLYSLYIGSDPRRPIVGKVYSWVREIIFLIPLWIQTCLFGKAASAGGGGKDWLLMCLLESG